MARAAAVLAAVSLVFVVSLLADRRVGAADPMPAPRAAAGAVAPDGTILAAICADGRHVHLHAVDPDGGHAIRRVRPPGLPEDGEIVALRVSPFLWAKERPRLALALAVRRPGAVEYRYAVEVGDAWKTSDPIFTESGEPWRIADLRWHEPDGDTLEILFARGFLSPRVGAKGAAYEARLFTDVCADVGRVGIRGKDALVELRPAP
jgi:hypothetical protein